MNICHINCTQNSPWMSDFLSHVLCSTLQNHVSMNFKCQYSTYFSTINECGFFLSSYINLIQYYFAAQQNVTQNNIIPWPHHAFYWRQLSITSLPFTTQRKDCDIIKIESWLLPLFDNKILKLNKKIRLGINAQVTHAIHCYKELGTLRLRTSETHVGTSNPSFTRSNQIQMVEVYI